MKKRILACLLAVVLLISVIPMPADAVMYKVYDDGLWVVGIDDRSPNVPVIVGYKGNASNVTIPTKVGPYIIKGVWDTAFRDNTTLKTITIPDGMGVYGLGGCNVETVILDDNVGLFTGAFENCTKLKNIELPANLTYIASSLFKNCVSLTSITLPSKIEEIGESAFEGCTGITTITLPDAVERISDSAFRNCTNLKSINIPKEVDSIHHDAFYFCSSLSSIKVDPQNTRYYNDADGNVCWEYRRAGMDCVELLRAPVGALKSIYTVPEHITVIGRSSFAGAKNLQKIVIPDSVHMIDLYAFDGCTNLKEIRLEGFVTIDNHVFDGVTAKVYYPGDTGEWDYLDPTYYDGNLTWIPYCTGIHKGSIGNVIKEASCTEPGSSENLCTLCGETYIYQIPMVAHSYDNGVVTKEAFCMTEGEMTYTCTVCGHFYTNYIPVPGHKYPSDVPENYVISLESTCTQKGTKLNSCTVCGTLAAYKIPVLGHDFSNAIPVYDENGRNHTIQCSRCGLTEKTEACVFAEEDLEAATPDTIGLKRYTCTVCSTSFEGQYIYRIAGANRFETALKVADQMKENLGIEKFDAVIIASGANFADALSGSYLASVKNAPILLSYKATQNQQVQAYIKSNLAEGGTVYILGGTSAVPADMENGLAGINVVRLDGANRFETNLMILKEAGVRPGQEILVCTSTNFADSLSASATGLPILLVYNEKSRLTDDQLAYLGSLSGNSFRIIGGENAVSPTLEAAIAAYGPVARLAGANRFETSVLVAKTYFDNPDYAVLAYAWNYPDGLCGGPLAYSMDAPLVLTMTKYDAAAAAYAEESGIERGIVLGGTGLISDDAVRNIFDLTATTPEFPEMPEPSEPNLPEGLTQEIVYQKLLALQEEYPEGMVWDPSTYYVWNGGIYKGAYGNTAFAFLLSDTIFGDLPATRDTRAYSTHLLRVGDVLRIDDDCRSVIILEVYESHVIVVECDSNNTIHWGRSVSFSEVYQSEYYLTRYPRN